MFIALWLLRSHEFTNFGAMIIPMTKFAVRAFPLLFFLLLVNVSYAQKVKYKDIFGLLSTKQYEQAEPFLKKYLNVNDDNPNAFLFMAMIFQEKSAKMDVLKQTREAMYFGDSAILYFDKAYKTVDDKEIRKNKEYYQAYNRRDLRTGEFGVKLSDIQFDIEKRMQALKERNDKLKMVKYYFVLSDSLYRKSNRLFQKLQQQYPVERQLLLRGDEQTLKNLATLSLRFDSCLKSFENYKTSSSFLGKTGYNHTLSLKPVSDFSADGKEVADFYKDDLALWDYKQFADKGKQTIEKEIIPMRTHLITYDIEINKLREKLNTDSVSVRSDLTKLIDVLLYEKLQKFDANPLPMDIFSMKTADLEYRSVLIEHKPLKDSADIHLQINLLNSEMKSLNKLDSISSKLATSDIEEKALDYTYFITNTYGSNVVVHSYIKALHDYAGRERKKKENQLALLNESLNWVIDATDSIPLTNVAKSKRNRSLLTVGEHYTVGVNVKDSIQSNGYFYSITPSRKPGLKVLFPIEQNAFKEKNLQFARALSYGDPEGHVYYVLLYSQRVSGQAYPATLAKIYRTDGLAWSNNLALTFQPEEIIFKPETSELIVKDATHQVVVDKNGKMLK
jgi:hypothetical protein